MVRNTNLFIPSKIDFHINLHQEPNQRKISNKRSERGKLIDADDGIDVSFSVVLIAL